MIWWRDEIEEALEDSVSHKELLSQIEDGMARLELKKPDLPTPDPRAEVNYNGFHGPAAGSADCALRRLKYAMNGTFNLLSYANDNLDKWMAYGKGSCVGFCSIAVLTAIPG